MKRILIPTILTFIIFPAFSQDVLYIGKDADLVISSGAAITVQGGLNAASGSSIVNNGDICLTNNSISNQSNWTDGNTAGVFATGSSGMVTFQSPHGHTITGNTIFPSVTLDASAATISNDVLITNNLVLKSGIFNTSTYKIYVLNSNPNSVQADAANANYTSSWVDGILQRNITTNTGTYEFPVGNSSHGNLLQFINNNITGTSSLTASFEPKPGTDAGLVVTENGTPYTSVNNGGVWYLDASSNATGGKYALQLYFNGFAGMADNQFGILRRNDASSNAADWVVPSGSALEPLNGAGRKVTDGYARRKNISTFSQLGIGMTSVALPITLLDFAAAREDKMTVKLRWSTSSESNNKGFEIEKRYENETQFAYSGFVASKASGGNSQALLNYIYQDNNSFSGVTYYRLKQVDLDGNFSYSAIKAVNGINASSVDVTIMPNPNHGQFTILMSGASQSHQALISDVNGRVIRQFILQPQQQVNVSELAHATYVLTIIDVFGKGKNFSEKIVIIH